MFVSFGCSDDFYIEIYCPVYTVPKLCIINLSVSLGKEHLIPSTVMKAWLQGEIVHHKQRLRLPCLAGDPVEFSVEISGEVGVIAKNTKLIYNNGTAVVGNPRHTIENVENCIRTLVIDRYNQIPRKIFKDIQFLSINMSHTGRRQLHKYLGYLKAHSNQGLRVVLTNLDFVFAKRDHTKESLISSAIFLELIRNFGGILVIGTVRNVEETDPYIMRYFRTVIPHGNPPGILSPDAFTKCILSRKIFYRLDVISLIDEIRLAASDRFTDLPFKCIMISGPSGSGKSFLARLIGDMTDCKIFNVTVAQIISAEVGESEKKLTSQFEIAKNTTPSILFFDDIEGILGFSGKYVNKSRDVYGLYGQMLKEIDRLSDGVLVIATTRHIPSGKDPIFRSGRFDTHLELGYPSIDERRIILQQFFPAQLGEILMEKTEKFSIADLVKLRRLVLESALIRIINESNDDYSVTRNDIFLGLERLY